MKTAQSYLSGNTYPGRGILLGLHEDGKTAVAAYFIMGRSESSRNRVFVEDGEDLRTQPYDMTKLVKPELEIYAPVRVLGNEMIVTNCDQTDTIYNFLREGKTFEEALRTREYEPDAPNFTPRISGHLLMHGAGFSYKLSILKAGGGEPKTCERFFYEYDAAPGQGHLIHTYRCDGRPVIPSFEGEPARVALSGGIDAFAGSLWEALDPDNKVSLFVRYIGFETWDTQTRVINKNQ